MAKSNPVGLMACPECGHPDAEVKQSRAGLLYRWCPECNAQYFPRTHETSERLGAKMRPIPGAVAPVTDTGKSEAPEVPEPVIDKPARAGFNLGEL